MKIILLGNYPPDGQESMERFAQGLEAGFRRAGAETEIWRPVVFFGAGGPTTAGVRKWLGYLDKWILFPLVLRWRLRGKALTAPDVRVHVCDHSNSPYLGHVSRERASITCHDVLAIRGSLGYADAYVSASRFGRVLQQWILHHLSRAERLASVSQLTMEQLLALANNAVAPPANWRVILNSFTADFRALPREECTDYLHRAGVPADAPFLLHMGSDLVRKNRKMLLDMVHALGSRWQGNICFAGDAPEPALLARAEALGLRDRVVAVVRPDHMTLMALYSACEAFVFPSYSEGFGLPVAEAQACGAPVLASNVAPMPEVSGGAAYHADPDDPQAFAEALLALQRPGARAALVQQGFANCHRFERDQIVQQYLDLYQLAPA